MALEDNSDLHKSFVREINTDIFQVNFLDAEIKAIDENSVIQDMKGFFEAEMTSLLFPQYYKQGNFDHFFAIHHSLGDITYVAQQTKVYPVIGVTEYSNAADTRDLVYLRDVTVSGEDEGYGVLIKSIKSNKPYVGYTSTEEEYQKKGLGKRRLLMMNALSQMLFGFPLHSDIIIRPVAESIWVKLATEGKAIKYNEEGRDRFMFTKS